MFGVHPQQVRCVCWAVYPEVLLWQGCVLQRFLRRRGGRNDALRFYLELRGEIAEANLHTCARRRRDGARTSPLTTRHRTSGPQSPISHEQNGPVTQRKTPISIYYYIHIHHCLPYPSTNLKLRRRVRQICHWPETIKACDNKHR